MMGRVASELNALAVSRLATKEGPGLHFVGGVPGLALQVTATGAQSWILRARIAGKRRDMGLGRYPGVSLADARRRAAEEREKIDKGRDPIQERIAARVQLAADRASALTFEECTRLYLAAKEAEWRSDKHRQQWANTLSEYAFPVIGKTPARDVEQEHIMRILTPLWTEKTETAKRLRGRIEQVLDFATVHGYRPKTENPARWKGRLDKTLPKPGKIAKVEHLAALPFARIGSFMVALRGMQGMGARALELAILTAARSGEVRGATWSEFDLDAATWTVPADRMKAGREHVVPLSPPAVAMLKRLKAESACELLFPNSKGGALSDMALTAAIRRLDEANIASGGKGWRDESGARVTSHGFRSCFRDWVGDATKFPPDVAEHALAHKLPDRVEAAYRRGSAFTKRISMMSDWGRYCGKVQPDSTVSQIRRATA